jgi:hypothetical protein
VFLPGVEQLERVHAGPKKTQRSNRNPFNPNQTENPPDFQPNQSKPDQAKSSQTKPN